MPNNEAALYKTDTGKSDTSAPRVYFEVVGVNLDRCTDAEVSYIMLCSVIPSDQVTNQQTDKKAMYDKYT